MVPSFQAPGRATSFAPVNIDTVRTHRGWFVGLGVAFMVLGLVAIFLPFTTSLMTALVIGWLMLIGGLLEGYHALRNRQWAGSGWEFVSAAVQVFAGLFVVAFPVTGKLMLTLVLAAYFVAEGLLKVVRAVQHRTMLASSWLVFDGLLSLALGVLILLHWPSAAVWALSLLVGINLLTGGFSMLLIGLGASRRAPARS